MSKAEVALVERAEIEAAEAEALAAEARARAMRLKAQAQRDELRSEDPEAEEKSGEEQGDDEQGDDGLPDSPEVLGRVSLRQRIAGLRWKRLTAAAVVVCSVTLLVLSALMIRQHQNMRAAEHERAEFVAAGRQVVVTLMSIDFNDAEGSVQRIVENSTGPFRDEFQGAAEDFIKVSKDAKVTTNATVNAAAVESMDPDSAVVLVSASSTVTNAAGAEEAPRRWRLTVGLQREGDQIKMSKVEFVP